MIPCLSYIHAFQNSILHVCGDDPLSPIWTLFNGSYSPRMWRWSYNAWARDKAGRGILHVCGDDPYVLLLNNFRRLVFSTYVEMILLENRFPLPPKGILHVCGDDPHHRVCAFFIIKYSPRMWRWSLEKVKTAQKKQVFSTYVEMILQHPNFQNYS